MRVLKKHRLNSKNLLQTTYLTLKCAKILQKCAIENINGKIEVV